MKLTKKIEAEIIKVMKTYWDAYMQGDLKTWVSFLPEDYRNIGTTNEEIWNSRDEIFSYTERVMDQLLGQAQLRNNKTEIIAYDPYVMVHELGEIFIKVDNDWNFYSMLRLSSLLKKDNGRWYILQQHGSYPDSKTTEGEAFAFDAMKAENIKLKEAVKNRTLELENKNRELEIEASLERIRAIAMSMQKAKGLLDVVEILFTELKTLGFTDIRNTIINIFYDAQEKFLNYDYSDYGVGGISEVDYNSHPGNKEFVEKMRKASKDFMVTEFTGKELDDWRKWRIEQGQMPDSKLDQAKSLYYYEFSIGVGSIGISTFSPVNEDQLKILNKIRNVFDLAYRRYADIAKAEAYAREAQIETSLERVRAVAMAMHKPEDLSAIGKTIFSDLKSLGFDSIRNTEIIINNDEKETVITYHYSEYGQDEVLEINYKENPIVKKWAEDLKKADNAFVPVSIPKKEMKSWDQYRQELGYKSDPKMESAKVVHYYSYSTGLGALSISTWQTLSDDQIEVLTRFRNVFKLSYQRYKDIEQAEAQAREAQIQLALERVRARTMAMHKSEELGDLSLELVKQVQALGVKTWFCAFNIYDDDPLGSLEWGSNGEGTFPRYRTPREGVFLRYYKLGQQGETFLINEIGEDECPAHYDYLCSLPGVGDQLLKMKAAGIPFPTSQIDHVAFFKYGYIIFITYEPVPEAHDIFIRFAKVFEQTYTRFLDLQKAEAQAREAQIEAALEKVRSRSMAMHKSEELQEVIQLIFEQFVNLKIHIEHTGFIMDYKTRDDMHIWLADYHGVPAEITIPYFDSPHWNSFLEAKEKGVDFFANQLTFEEKNKFYKDLFEFIPGLPEEIKENYFNCPGLAISTVLMDNVGLYIENFSGTPYTDEENNTLMRFGRLFQQTYTRFLDLQKAEAQTREARIETALEKVRARALAMQKPEELKEVALVMRQEMGLLGIEELETSSIYINDKKMHLAECWYAIKDVRKTKKKLVTDQFTLDFNDTWVGRKMLKFYQSNDDQISIRMSGKPRIEWIRYCEEKSIPLRGYYGDIIPDRTYHLYKFSNGAIGAATPGDFSPENWILLKRAAAVFSLAYSRFKDLTQARYDLKLLKEEKKRAEDALTELKSTQSQLIHAEKMASLGELTAGIAHEIQNPLNFVNNFSEVSVDLVEEMNEELESGQIDEVKFIAVDLKQNLEKIHHHGERASSIVKGMLEHSRAGDGKKEPTDMNALADEYLRLAYHGLRAKDKSFNAEFKTDLDKNLPKAKVVQQEIGRVLLNLINNAFHAVNEKSKQHLEGYNPEVIVKTVFLPLEGGKRGIEIRVKDNGNGIPPKILDKIFQPFFTTKPTGEGTGLGLSMSYDIISKGHGGSLKVETKKDVGSEFIIQLPV